MAVRWTAVLAVVLALGAGGPAAAHQEYDADDGNVGNLEIAFTDDEAGGCELFPGWEHCGYYQHGLGTVSRVTADRSDPVHADGSLLLATPGARDRLRLTDPHRDQVSFVGLQVAGYHLKLRSGESPRYSMVVSCPDPVLGVGQISLTHADPLAPPRSGWHWVDVIRGGDARWADSSGTVLTLDEQKARCPGGVVDKHSLVLSSPDSRARVDNVVFGDEVTNFWIPSLARVLGDDHVRGTSYAADQLVTDDAVADLMYRGWNSGYDDPAWVDPNRPRLPTAKGFVVANRDSRWGALVGAALARSINGPLVYGTRRSAGDYPPRGTTAYLVGGRRQISREAAANLRKRGYDVRRIAGPTPARTAVEVALFIGRRTPDRRLPITLAPWQVPADALTAGAVATVRRGAVLLSDRNRLPAATKRFLRHRRHGPVVTIGRAAAQAMPWLRPERKIRGATPARTALRVARTFFTDPRSVTVSSLDQPGDALLAASYAGRTGHPLVLVRSERVPVPVRRYLRDLAERVDSSVLVGGRPAVDASTFDRLRRLLTPEQR